MAAQQFGFVMFRFAGILAAFLGLNHAYSVVYAQVWTKELMRSLVASVNYVSIVFACIFILLAAFLWTFADKLSGPERTDRVTVRAGNWVVRLAFTCLGIFLMLNGINAVVNWLSQLLFPEFRPDKGTVYAGLIIDSLKFLIGVYLFATYKFDRAAAFEAAQAIEPPIED